MIQKNMPYIGISLTLHLMLIIGLSWQPHSQSHSFRLGDKPSNIVLRSYLYKDNATQQHRAKKMVTDSSTPEALAIQQQQQTQQRENTLVRKSGGTKVNAWLALLHEKIKAQQHYPLIAKKLKWEGRVTVQFDVLPNGRVENLSVFRSSSIPVIDTAAIESVTNAAPFEGANKVQNDAPRTYQVDVVFKLT